MDSLPDIVCERFDGETRDTYRRRSEEVVEIIQGFRNLRFRGEVAEQMERRLMVLQEPHLEHLW